MPNWSNTTYRVTGNHNGISALNKALQRMSERKKSKISNGFGPMWLGELVYELGGNWEEIRCRGEITWFEKIDDGTLTINMMCAWCEQSELRHWLEAKHGLKIYFIDEEPDCQVFETNDVYGVYFPNRFFLDSYEEPQYFKTIHEAADYVGKLVGKDVEASVNSIDTALDDYIEDHDDEDIWYSFHEFTIVSD